MRKCDELLERISADTHDSGEIRRLHLRVPQHIAKAATTQPRPLTLSLILRRLPANDYGAGGGGPTPRCALLLLMAVRRTNHGRTGTGEPLGARWWLQPSLGSTAARPSASRQPIQQLRRREFGCSTESVTLPASWRLDAGTRAPPSQYGRKHPRNSRRPPWRIEKKNGRGEWI